MKPGKGYKTRLHYLFKATVGVPAETYSEDTAGGVTVESPPPPPPTSGQT